MILVDSSVWVDYFNGLDATHTRRLHDLLIREQLAVGDLILAEVLQGFLTEREFRQAERLLTSLYVVELCGERIAIQAARYFRLLRQRGLTVRKTIDCVIATKCIEDGLRLLHNDRDFDPFVEHFGLSTVL